MPDWQRRFDDPIPLPGGRQLASLRDAAEYVTGLPKAEHDAPEWQAAMEAPLLVAEHDGPMMFAIDDACLAAMELEGVVLEEI